MRRWRRGRSTQSIRPRCHRRRSFPTPRLRTPRKATSPETDRAMSAEGLIFVVAAVVVTVALVAWFVMVRRRPESGAPDPPDPGLHGTERFHSDLGRPAGPGAEDDGV